MGLCLEFNVEREIEMTSAIVTQTIKEPLKKKVRDPFYDNLRLFLMFSVVFCHGLGRVVTSSPYIRAVYVLLHMFTMPCFVILTGFFGKGMAEAGSNKRLRIINTMLLYLIVQVLKMWADGTTKTITIPLYGNWFFIGMIFWYAVLPAVKKFKPVVVFAVALIASMIMVAYGNTVSVWQLERAFAYFPFFLVGYYIDKAQAAVLKRQKVRLVGVAVLIVTAVITLLLRNNSPFYWSTFGDQVYSEVGATRLGAMGLRLGWYALATAMSFGVMCVIPRKKFFLTKIGTRTLPIFIGHTILYHYLIERTDFFTRLARFGRGYTRLAVIFVGSLVLTLILGNKWLNHVIEKFLAWDLGIFLKKSERKKRT